MKINNDIKLKAKIDEVIRINQINTWIAGLFNEVNSYTDFFSKDKIDYFVKKGHSEAEAMTAIICGEFNIERDEELDTILTEFVSERIKCLEAKEYLNNEYASRIKATGRYKQYALRMIDYVPYQTFAYDEISVTSDYKEYSAIGYFKKPFSYLALTQGNNIWMSLNPNEIETMKPYIAKGKGDILVLGLGMGYVPYMLALKEDVRSVLIVERDKDIINLFKSLIWPNFVNKNKIKIVEADAIDYVSKNKGFDYIFADLWHDPEDGLPLFVSLKRIDKGIDCWLETSMYALLRRCMITLIEETLNGSKEEDYKFAKIYTDKVINQYYQKTKNLPINTKEDLIALLSDENILSLMTE